MKNIVLIGMMGCGKTTCAALLARQLGRETADTDQLIAQREGRTISAIFAAEGEGYFRALERECAEALALRQDLVISCGGGLPLRPDCIGPLRRRGTVFFLNRSPDEIFDTVSMAGRPLGQGGREAFLERFRLREPRYRACADHVIDEFASPEATVAAIMEVLK